MKIWVIKEVAQSRFDICKQCDNLNTENFRCSECGCYMKWAVKLANHKCPIDKWEKDYGNT